MTVPDRLRLPLDVDLAGMVADVQALPEETWTPHFNTQIYEGDWSGVALRSVSGSAVPLYPDPTAGEAFADTDVLARCPHVAAAVEALACPLTAVRLLALGPGAAILEHSDYKLGYDDGEVRLHVPIVTAPEVEFFLDGIPVFMGAGECWYLNLNLPHRAANHSTRRRIHLVADCILNDRLMERFTRTAAHP